MAHCAIFEKGSDEIKYFIRNCVQRGRDFIGSGSDNSLGGVSEEAFDALWTNDEVEPVYGTGHKVIGYNKLVSELTEAVRYNGVAVSSGSDVDAVTRSRIRERYDLEEELKVSRLGRDSKEWQEYDAFVSAIVAEGREFKKTVLGVTF